MTNEALQQYFSEQCSVEGNVIRLGSSQLERADYNQVKKVLESRGGKWKGRKIQGFVFDDDATAIFESLCSGDLENKKNVYQYFPTPEWVADMMVDKLVSHNGINSHMRILEPSAGRGALISAVHKEFPEAVVSAYEINPDCFPKLEKTENVVLHKSDFLEISEKRKYHVIIANPPFANNADIRHFRKMYDMLIAGGQMCVIMSSHAFEAREREVSEFKEWLYSLNPEVEPLAEGTFKDSGTDVRTFMVWLKKSHSYNPAEK